MNNFPGKAITTRRTRNVKAADLPRAQRETAPKAAIPTQQSPSSPEVAQPIPDPPHTDEAKSATVGSYNAESESPPEPREDFGV